MRIEEISLSGFRGFRSERVLDLNADVVLLTGSNGTGKTSLVDAIQWCLLGRIPRLERLVLKTSEDYVSNRYAETPPTVTVTLSHEAGSYRISRKGTGQAAQTAIHERSSPSSDWSAVEDRDEVMKRILGTRPDAKTFLRTFMLQQDEVKEFLAADPKERYSFLSQLAGLEDAQRLDAQIKSELTKMREASRELASRLAEQDSRTTALRDDRSASHAILERQVAFEDDRLWSAVRDMAGVVGVDSPQSVQDLPGLVEIASERIRQLSTLRVRASELVAFAESAETRAAAGEASAGRLSELRSEVAQLEEEASDLQRQADELDLRANQAAADEARISQLAELALEHLTETCPVCDRPLASKEHEHAVAHLESLVTGERLSGALREQADAMRARAAELGAKLSAQRRDLGNAEAAESALMAARESGDKARRGAQEALVEASGLMGGPEGWDVLDQLTRQHGYVVSAMSAMTEFQVAGVRLQTLDREIQAEERTLASLQGNLDELQARVASSEDVRTWLGHQIVSTTTEIVRNSTPLINELYARLDVHPYLRRFDFRDDRFYEAGRVRPWVYDDDRKVSGNAAQVLSSAQLNALAVCLFLALNLGQRWSELSVAILDDPVQSMDDVNALGLADTLRSVRRYRQLIVSTHDPDLTELLWRKLRPLEADQRTRKIELSDWTIDGPKTQIDTREGELTERRLELLAG